MALRHVRLETMAQRLTHEQGPAAASCAVTMCGALLLASAGIEKETNLQRNIRNCLLQVVEATPIRQSSCRIIGVTATQNRA
jgi:glycerol-3-phosphate O-acyltransferase